MYACWFTLNKIVRLISGQFGLKSFLMNLYFPALSVDGVGTNYFKMLNSLHCRSGSSITTMN